MIDLNDLPDAVVNTLNVLTDEAVEKIPVTHGSVLVRDGYSVEHLDDRPPARKHAVNDLPSLLAWAKRWGKPEESTLFCDPGGFVLVLDDTGSQEVGREIVSYHPTLSTAAKAWLGRGAAGAPWTKEHIPFKRFVEERADDLVDHELLDAVLRFKTRTEFSYDADLEDGKSVSFTVVSKQGSGKGVVTLPKVFSIRIPLFRGTVNPETDDERLYDVECRLSYEQVADGSKIAFEVRPQHVAELMDKALADLVADARADLGPAWLIVSGAPCYR